MVDTILNFSNKQLNAIFLLSFVFTLTDIPME